MNFTCTDCKGSFNLKQVAYEYVAHQGSFGAYRRAKAILRYCAECHATNEWNRQQAANAVVAEVLASLTPEQRAAYEERKTSRS